jgi:hypothetical protein
MPSSKNPWVTISAVVVFFSFLLFVSIPFLGYDAPLLPPGPSTASFHAPKENVWADLNEKETNELVKFLFSREELNLTDSKRATRSAPFFADSLCTVSVLRLLGWSI